MSASIHDGTSNDAEAPLFKPNRRADGALADFLRCSLLTYGAKYARRSRLENRPSRRRWCASHLWDDALE